MEIKYRKQFLKNFKIRIKPNSNLLKRFDERVELFLEDPSNPLLKDHQLSGNKVDFRAFSVTGDIR